MVRLSTRATEHHTASTPRCASFQRYSRIHIPLGSVICESLRDEFGVIARAATWASTANRDYFTDEIFCKRLAKPPQEDMRAAALEWAKVFGNSLRWDDLGWLRRCRYGGGQRQVRRQQHG